MPAESQVRRAALGIRIAALLHLIGAGLGLTILPKVEHLFATILLSSISLILAIGLVRYDYRAYKVAVVCYFAWGMVSVISIPYGAGSILGLLLSLLAIYAVGNKTAKAIFERRLPDDA